MQELPLNKDEDMGWFNWLRKKWKEQGFFSFNPRPGCLKPIEDSKYDPEFNACRHKARDAYWCLKENGYNVKVVSGPVKGLERYHIWIEIEYDGEKYWYDPTWYNADPVKYGCCKVEFWTDRKVG